MGSANPGALVKQFSYPEDCQKGLKNLIVAALWSFLGLGEKDFDKIFPTTPIEALKRPKVPYKIRSLIESFLVPHRRVVFGD